MRTQFPPTSNTRRSGERVTRHRPRRHPATLASRPSPSPAPRAAAARPPGEPPPSPPGSPPDAGAAGRGQAHYRRAAGAERRGPSGSGGSAHPGPARHPAEPWPPTRPHPPAERRHSPDAPAAPLAPEAGPPLPLSVPPLPPSVSRAQKHGKRVPPPPCENVSRAAPAGPGVSAGAVTRLDCVETRVPGRQRTRTLRAGVSRRGSHARRNPRDGRTEPCPPRVPSPLGPKPRGVPGSPVFTLELQIRPTVVRWYIGTSFRRAVVKKS